MNKKVEKDEDKLKNADNMKKEIYDVVNVETWVRDYSQGTQNK